MGNPRCQGDRALASYRTNDSLAIIDISRLLRLQTGGQGAIASGIRRYSTAPTRMRRARRGSIVKAAALYTNRLAPDFKSDWQEHSSILVQTAPSNFLALAVVVCDRASPAYQQFS